MSGCGYDCDVNRNLTNKGQFAYMCLDFIEHEAANE